MRVSGPSLIERFGNSAPRPTCAPGGWWTISWRIVRGGKGEPVTAAMPTVIEHNSSRPIRRMPATPIAISLPISIEIIGTQPIAGLVDGPRLKFGSNAMPVAVYCWMKRVARCPSAAQLPRTYVARHGLDIARECLHPCIRIGTPGR